MLYIYTYIFTLFEIFLNSKFISHVLLLKKYPCFVTCIFFSIEALLYTYKVVTKKPYSKSYYMCFGQKYLCILPVVHLLSFKTLKILWLLSKLHSVFSCVNSFENALARTWETNCECCRSVNGMGCIKFLMLRGLFLLHTIFSP